MQLGKWMKALGIASPSQLQALLQTAAKSAMVRYKAKRRRKTGVPSSRNFRPPKDKIWREGKPSGKSWSERGKMTGGGRQPIQMA
jgi:hypothetical protein